MRKRGVSGVISSSLLILLVVVSVAIIGIVILRSTHTIDQSIIREQCRIENPYNDDSYNNCVAKNIGTISVEETNLPESTNQYLPADGLNLNGLVAYYPFEEDFNDHSGREHNPMDVRNVFFDSLGSGNHFAVFNKSLYSGGTISISVINSEDMQSDNQTISYWLKPAKKSDASASVYPIIHEGNVNAPGYSIYLSNSYQTGFNWKILINATNTRDNSQCNFSDNYFNAPILNDDGWHYFVHTRDKSGNYTIYLDGRKRVSGNGCINPSYDQSGGILFMGSNFYGGFYNGSIDEIMFFNKTLNESEILKIYEHELIYFSNEPVIPNNISYNYLNQNNVDTNLCYLSLNIEENRTKFEYGDSVILVNPDNYLDMSIKQGLVKKGYSFNFTNSSSYPEYINGIRFGSIGRIGNGPIYSDNYTWYKLTLVSPEGSVISGWVPEEYLEWVERTQKVSGQTYNKFKVGEKVKVLSDTTLRNSILNNASIIRNITSSDIVEVVSQSVKVNENGSVIKKDIPFNLDYESKILSWNYIWAATNYIVYGASSAIGPYVNYANTTYNSYLFDSNYSFHKVDAVSNGSYILEVQINNSVQGFVEENNLWKIEKVNFSLVNVSSLYGDYSYAPDYYFNGVNYILEAKNENGAIRNYNLSSTRFSILERNDTNPGQILTAGSGNIRLLIPKYFNSKNVTSLKINYAGKDKNLEYNLASVSCKRTCGQNYEAINVSNGETCCAGSLPQQQNDGVMVCTQCGDGFCHPTETKYLCPGDCQ